MSRDAGSIPAASTKERACEKVASLFYFLTGVRQISENGAPGTPFQGELGPMNTGDGGAVYASPVRFDENRIRAAAIYCSDGRFGEQCDDFLHNALRLPRYDRLAAPGGAACLAGHFFAYREEEALLEHLRFLIAVHGLERLVLIAHQDCAYYTGRLHVPAGQLETRQRTDLQAAAERVRALARGLRVEAFFARKGADGAVRFEAVGGIGGIEQR
jgi:hypothetical protein